MESFEGRFGVMCRRVLARPQICWGFGFGNSYSEETSATNVLDNNGMGHDRTGQPHTTKHTTTNVLRGEYVCDPACMQAIQSNWNLCSRLGHIVHRVCPRRTFKNTLYSPQVANHIIFVLSTLARWWSPRIELILDPPSCSSVYKLCVRVYRSVYKRTVRVATMGSRITRARTKKGNTTFFSK